MGWFPVCHGAVRHELPYRHHTGRRHRQLLLGYPKEPLPIAYVADESGRPLRAMAIWGPRFTALLQAKVSGGEAQTLGGVFNGAVGAGLKAMAVWFPPARLSDGAAIA
jgi:hypothetical protein